MFYYSWSVNYYILIAFIEVASQWTFRARVIKNGIVTDVYSDPISLDNWYYVAFSYDSNSDTIYLVVNNEIYYSFCSGLWGSSGNAYLRAYAAFYYDTQYLQRSNVDELVYTPNQFIDPQVFIDHYNNDVPWGAEYIP